MLTQLSKAFSTPSPSESGPPGVGPAYAPPAARKNPNVTASSLTFIVIISSVFLAPFISPELPREPRPRLEGVGWEARSSSPSLGLSGHRKPLVLLPFPACARPPSAMRALAPQLPD